jgi:hypothetical protein
VNFVSNSWFDYGLKCQDIYRKSREKIPVFPYEWLIVENAKNIATVSLDQETLLKLRDVLRKIVKDEKKAREWIEKTGKELAEEKQQEGAGGHPTRYAKTMIMENRDNVAEDAHQCYYCTDFAYMSLVKCTHHKIHYCLYH